MLIVDGVLVPTRDHAVAKQSKNANGLMRYSGPVYQFRNRELQQWLATRPSPISDQ